MKEWWAKFWLILFLCAACAVLVAETSRPILLPEIHRIANDDQYRAATAQQISRNWPLIVVWGAGVIACVGALAYLWKRNEDQL